jgi:hypothetical protein
MGFSWTPRSDGSLSSRISLSPSPATSKKRLVNLIASSFVFARMMARFLVANFQSPTSVLNPPYIMRLASKGISSGPPICPIRGSFITLAFTRSRCARDL